MELHPGSHPRTASESVERQPRRYERPAVRRAARALILVLTAAAAMAGLAAFASAAEAFAIYNRTGEDIQAYVRTVSSQGDFYARIRPGDHAACHWSNKDCNPGGGSDQDRKSRILVTSLHATSSSSYRCQVLMEAAGYVVIERIPRRDYAGPDVSDLAPDYRCVAYTADHRGFNVVPRSGVTTSALQRDVRFLVTADPQYDRECGWNWNNIYGCAWKDEPQNVNADMVLGDMRKTLCADRSVRGIIVAGDVIQGPEGDAEAEWERYNNHFAHRCIFFEDMRRSVANVGQYVYDGFGNHDKGAIDLITGRRRSTRLTAQPGSISSQGKALPHYSWDWHDVHFVQLNLGAFERAGTCSECMKEDPRSGLTFLREDLRTNVKRSATGTTRPVVIIAHYGFDTVSKGGPKGNGEHHHQGWSEEDRRLFLDLVKDYNVIAMFTGHAHLGHHEDSPRMLNGKSVPKWANPPCAAGLCANFGAYTAGAAENGVYLDVRIQDQTMTITRMSNAARGSTAFIAQPVYTVPLSARAASPSAPLTSRP